MNYLNNIIAATLLLSLLACGKSDLAELSYQTEVDLEAGIQGEIYDPTTNETTAYSFSYGPQEEDNIYYRFQSANFLNNESRISLLAEVYDVIRFVYNSEEYAFTKVESYPIFSLEFFSNYTLEGNGGETWQEGFETYFAPGTLIPVGSGVGELAVGIRLPEAAEEDHPPSKSSYLPAPDGQFEVISIEDYTYESESFFLPDVVTGKMVEGNLTATVGRYDWSLDEVDGIPGYLTTDEVLLQNFRVRFFVPLTQ